MQRSDVMTALKLRSQDGSNRSCSDPNDAFLTGIRNRLASPAIRIFPTVLSLLLAGCLPNTTAVRPAADEIIWTPQTEYGRVLKTALEGDFRQLILEVRSSPQLADQVDFVRDGIMITLDTAGVDTLAYVAIHLRHQTTYNTLRTSYLNRAAGSYLAVLFPLARILATHSAFFMLRDIDGFSVTLSWRATDFLDDRHRLRCETEGMSATIPKDVLRDFAAWKLSIQELARRSSFKSPLGCVELDFSGGPPSTP